MSEQYNKTTDQVARVLHTIGWRAALARHLPYLTIALTIGIAAYGLAVIWQGGAGNDLLLTIVTLTLTAMFAIAALAMWHRRDLATVARRTDFSLGLSEQLSTAIDVPAGKAAQSPVQRSLMAEAHRAAAGIAIKQAIPIYSRLLGLTLGALLLAVCGATAAYSLRDTPRTTPPAEEIAAAETPETISAEDIEVLAKLVEDDADRKNSDYLQALANSMKTLAQSARDGASQAEVQSQLEALLEHAAAGYQGQMPNWMSDTTADASTVLQNAVAFSQARQQAADERAKLPPSANPRVKSSDMYTLTDDRMAKSATPLPPGHDEPMEGGMANREGELQNASLGGADFAARPMEDEAFESAGSLPVGAAAQSGKGESNIAGGGSQALAKSTGFLETMADPTEVMSISSEETNEGSRIRMHVPTTAELSDAGAAGSGGGTAWARQLAQSVSREVISPDASTVVSRYFNRPVEGQGN